MFARSTSWLLLGVVFIPLGLLSAGVIPAAQFQRERIEITVREDSLEVNGLYVYSNPFPVPVPQGLKVPFVERAGQLAPATVSVVEVDPRTGNDRAALQVLWVNGLPHFTARLPARGVTWVRVRFRQQASTQTATYLLTTTQPWRRPLDAGEYILHAEGVSITSSNYPFDRPDCQCFARRQFMPRLDWSFTWTAK